VWLWALANSPAQLGSRAQPRLWRDAGRRQGAPPAAPSTQPQGPGEARGEADPWRPTTARPGNGVAGSRLAGPDSGAQCWRRERMLGTGRRAPSPPDRQTPTPRQPPKYGRRMDS